MGKNSNINLENSIDSLFNEMEKLFRECDSQKSDIKKTILARNNRFANLDDLDMTDITDLGKVNNQSFNSINDVINKKIELVKIHAKVIKDTMVLETKLKDSKAINKKDEGKLQITDDLLKSVRKVALENIQQDVSNNAFKNKEYDLSNK